MFDTEKAKQLQKQSHVRGMLSKQFFSGEQQQLQKKRRQMKRILDEQVQERKRAKQKQKAQQQKKQRKQQQQIRKYYQNVVERDRRLSQNNSNPSHIKNFPNDQSLVKKHYQQNMKSKTNSKPNIQLIQSGDIPLMPVMAMSDGQINLGGYHNTNNSIHSHSYSNSQQFNNNSDRQNYGNIPLLDLSDQANFMKNKKKSKTQIKRQKTERQNTIANQAIANSNVKFKESRDVYQQNIISQSLSSGNYHQSFSTVQVAKSKQRRKTLSDQQNNSIGPSNIINSRMSKVSKGYQSNLNKSPSNTKRNTQLQIPQQIQQMQNQNRLLKSELKKSQQAISLLIGAVRSNAKLDKFRIQAQRILHNSQNESKVNIINQAKNTQKRQQSPLLLPKIKIKHQSIMQDYLIEAAKKARLKNIKSQHSKY